MSDKPEISISESSNVIANSNINVGGDFIGPGGQKVTINPSWSPAVVESATKEIYTRLSPILKRRAIDEERSRDEIKALAEDVSAEGSFLAFAESHARAEVFYWAARLYASQPENAQDYLYTCLKVDHHFDVSIANSLILDNKGDTDGALQILRDIDNAEAHSTLFSILTRRRGRDLALSWLDSQIEHNDPGFMTGLGWFNVAVALSQEDNWEGSAEILARVNESAEEWPDLAFLEGIVNVALMLPVAHRAGVLRMALFHSSIRPTWGTQTETHRHHAAKCFQRAERLMKEIDVPERIQAGNIWQLWLRLTDPDPVVAEAALKEVQDGMNDIRKAVELVPFTRTFEIPFNPDPLRRYLEDRRVTGGLNGREIIADVLLKKSLLSPRDFAKLLEQEEERFAEVVSRSTIAGWLIEALVADTQIEKARHTLEKRRTDLSDDYNRLEAKILKHEGKDPRQKLEEIYHQSNRLIDLKNLIGYLGTAEDWTALRPLSEKLFQLDPTPDSAKQLIQCLFNFPNGAASVIAFFDEHQEVVNWGADLLSKKAWALFDSGRLAEALVINDRLLSERFSADDLHLDLNIALQSGNWERFPLIVDKAWDRREDHDPNTLLRLATIAAEADVTAQRAMDFAKLAVENDPDSAGTLLQAYGLALHLGREGDVEADWLARAIQLSPPEGPVRQVDIRTVVEKIIPAHRERIDHVENSIHKGEIPLHGAASILNLPLSAFLIDLPKINAEQQDGRKIVIIPIVSGQRSPVEVQKDWTIGLDITSIMVLCYIDLLPEALSAFNKVVLAPDTMMLLLEERRHVRFQQPSRAKDAEEINSQIDRGLLRIEQSEVKPPEWLENEVGHDLAELLETARKLSGRVILPSSINRIGTYIEGKADLREYQEIVLPIRAFIRLLNEKGYIDPALYKRSDDYLAIIDHAEAEAAPSNSLDGPLYLDSLSLTYLQYAGILQAVCISGLDMRVHHTIRQEMASLINAAQEGERRADILDKIRVTLRNALNEGQVIFLPRKASSENNEHISTLAQFMEGLDVIDAICVDDRLSNSFTLWTDKENSRSVPTLCVLDVLNYLEKVGKINSTKRYLSILNLRKSGFALLPIDSKELRSIVNTGRPTKEGGLIESTGMKSLRQTLNRIGSLKVVQTPKEARFLVELQRACFQVIHQIWDDGGMEVEKAVILSLWLWRDIIVFLACTWAERQISEPQMSHSDMLSHLISLLLLWNPSARDDRYKKYLDWVDQDVLNPLLIANARVVASVAQSIKASIETYSGTLGTAEANLLAAHLFKWSPLVIRKRLLRDESFTGQFGLSKKILTINETIFVETNSLIASARKVLDGEGEQRLVSQNGLEIRLFINDEVIQLSYLNESCDLMEIPLAPLMILSSDSEVRVRALRKLTDFFGPTANEIFQIALVAEKRSLSNSEIIKVVEELTDGVAKKQENMRRALHEGQVTAQILFPVANSYYEHFCGPLPIDVPPEEYLTAVLPNYRKELLARNLSHGLDICLLGALRDDLLPSIWTKDIGDEELWNAINSCDPFNAPFSLLASLDIALSRQHDERFCSFAEKAIVKLSKDKFSRSDGADGYEIMALFSDITYETLVTSGGWSYPPYWRRMCSWMQAGLLLQLTAPLDLNLEELKKWIGSLRSLSGRYAKILDLRHEPMYIAGEMSCDALRAEILGRLISMISRYKSEGITIPSEDKVEEAKARFVTNRSELNLFLAGPLEGHLSPAAIGGRVVPNEILTIVLKELQSDVIQVRWSLLARLAQLYELGDRVLTEIHNSVARLIPTGDGEPEIQDTLKSLLYVCLIAVAERDKELSEAIISSMLSCVSSIKSAESALIALGAIVLAGASFEADEAWSIWIKEHLSALASRLPFGEPCASVLDHLREIEKLLSCDSAVTRQAKCIAGAGV